MLRLLVCVLAAYSIGVSAKCFEPVDMPDVWSPMTFKPDRLGAKTLSVHVALKQQNVDVLAAELEAISYPSSDRYGQHYSVDALRELIAPPAEDAAAVAGWFAKQGVSSIEGSLTGDFLTLTSDVATLSRALGCALKPFQSSETGAVVLRCDTAFCLPGEVGDAVDVVFGVHGFPYGRHKAIRPENSDNDAAAAASDVVEPAYLIEKYNITVLSSAEGVMGSQAVAEFDDNFYNVDDIQTFFTDFAPDLVGQTAVLKYGHNDNATRDPSPEANLDIQMIMSIGTYVPTYVYGFGNSNNILDQFLEYMYLIGNDTSPPLVHSVSYGEYGGIYPNETVQRVSTEFMKAGARGITIFFASGDDGVGCADCKRFQFPYPSSPYITMVGATQFGNGHEPITNSTVENGASLSSGGFSDDYWQPSFQNKAVPAYLSGNTTFPPSHFYNFSLGDNGRGIPDVAACGWNFGVVLDGKVSPLGGTSVASPLFAGIVSLINNARLNAGKSSMGWLNPFLYETTSALTDITTGDNSYMCCPGFHGAVGWDAVTGLGSPDMGALLEAAMALP